VAAQLVAIKCWQSTEWLHNLWPLEWYSAPQSQLVTFLIAPRIEAMKMIRESLTLASDSLLLLAQMCLYNNVESKCTFKVILFRYFQY
jgi:hypothetical protein